MKIEFTCSNCGKRDTTVATVRVPEDMYWLGYRAVGDALYCPECVKTWPDRNGKPFDEQMKDPQIMLYKWWANICTITADRKGKTRCAKI